MISARFWSTLCASLTLSALLALPALAAPAKEGKKPEAPKGPVYCAVTGEEIADVGQASSSTVFKDKTYYFCCAGCEPAFKKDPAKFARAAEEREAKRKAGKKAEAEAPAAPSGPAKPGAVYCAVRGEELASAEKAAGKAEYNGKTYYFCCNGCKKAFDKDPVKAARAADEREAKRAQK